MPWPDWRVYRGADWRPRLLLRSTAKLLVGGLNRLQGLLAQRDWGKLAIGNLSAHNFALLTVCASLTETLRQLHTSGFAVAALFDPQGRCLPLASAVGSTAPWFNIVAQKPSDADGMPPASSTMRANDRGATEECSSPS